MEKKKEVMRRIIELNHTLSEGFEYVTIKLNELKYEEAFEVLMNIVEGIGSIEQAMVPIMSELSKNDISSLSNELKSNLRNIVTIYENNQMSEAEEELKNKLIPAFENWKNEIQRKLQPYILI